MLQSPAQTSPQGSSPHLPSDPCALPVPRSHGRIVPVTVCWVLCAECWWSALHRGLEHACPAARDGSQCGRTAPPPCVHSLGHVTAQSVHQGVESTSPPESPACDSLWPLDGAGVGGSGDDTVPVLSPQPLSQGQPLPEDKPSQPAVEWEVPWKTASCPSRANLDQPAPAGLQLITGAQASSAQPKTSLDQSTPAHTSLAQPIPLHLEKR